MIKYILKCEKDHEFESWFSNSDEFERLKIKNLLECIYCPSNTIQKSIMSPMISSTKQKEESYKFFNNKILEEKDKLLKLRKYVEKNFEFVGDKFSKKVREVYYDKKNKKNIYGTVSLDEKEELAEEGIDLFSIPWVNKDN